MISKDYKCPQCGGTLAFDPESQKLKCNGCGQEYDPSIFAEFETDKMEKSSYEKEDTNTVTYICQNCGGELVTDANTSATKCPYCDSTIVLSERMAEEWKPDKVIPFQIGKEKAKQILRDFYKDKKLLPNAFGDENHINEVIGMYVPYWLFSGTADASITYDGKKTTSWRSGNYRNTKTDYYALKRAGEVSFQNIPADGSKKMDDTYMESLEPFDYSKLTSFQMNYLAGYIADKYDVSKEEHDSRMKERVKNTCVDKLRVDMGQYSGCSVDSIQKMDVTYSDVDYAMLPVWILNTKYQDKLYTFMINGQTGKIAGNLPVDQEKYKKNFLMRFLISFALLMIINVLIFW